MTRWICVGGLFLIVFATGCVTALVSEQGEGARLKPRGPVPVFDGETTRIEIPYDEALALNSGGTIEAWIYITGPGDSIWPRIASQSAWPGAEGGWQLIVEDQQWLRLSLGGKTRYTLARPMAPERWHHVAAAFDGRHVQFYIDGTPAPTVPETLGVLPAGDDVDVCIGDVGGEKHSRKFEGRITEVRLWDRMRDPEQVQQNWSRRLIGNEEGLVAYWPLNEGVGDTIADAAGDHDGRLLGAVRWQPALPLDP